MVSQKIYLHLLLLLLFIVTAFHLCLIVKLIPYNLAWGGQLKSDFQMYVFEAFSIIGNLFLGLVLLMKGNYIKSHLRYKSIDRILWFFLALFTLNTIGNLFAKTIFEKSFAGLTFVLAILIWKILKIKNRTITIKKG